MKTSKIKLGLFILITLTAINSLVINVSAQQACRAIANSIYFTEVGDPSGTAVNGVHPGNKKGYYLNILGNGASNFDVTKTQYMTGLTVVNVSTTAAIWQVNFEANMAQVIPSLKMTNKCTGVTRLYTINPQVRLFNQ